LVQDHEADFIPRSIQPVAGRAAQEYNRRKGRKGAFWQDPYHATAVESGSHFLRCLVYIDLNMVRNGVVSHPSAWRHGGCDAIQSPPKRYRLIDREQRLACCGIGSDAEPVSRHRERVEETMTSPRNVRQAEWSEAPAVGSEGFADGVCSALGVRARGRQVRHGQDHCMLKEQAAPYGATFGAHPPALPAGPTHHLNAPQPGPPLRRCRDSPNLAATVAAPAETFTPRCPRIVDAYRGLLAGFQEPCRHDDQAGTDDLSCWAERVR
jgi:putative transposase